MVVNDIQQNDKIGFSNLTNMQNVESVKQTFFNAMLQILRYDENLCECYGDNLLNMSLLDSVKSPHH